MKYLKRVILKNFQSHKNSTIEFDEGLNIIVGPSDSGKSAIIRGIKWALYNDPLGDYFIREGETEASVTLEFSNNIKIKRLRSKSRNAYMLYNLEGDEIVFEGFGSKVPEEIVEILSIKKIPLDSNETNTINLSEQLEGAFLLSESGSVRASVIGRLVGVNLIDDALKDTLKDVRNISINRKIITENIETIKKELTTYDYLDKLKENIKELDRLKYFILKKTEIKNKLMKNKEIYTAIKKEKQEINRTVEKLDIINILEENIYKLENKSLRLKTYNYINIRYIESKQQIKYNKNLLRKFEYLYKIEEKMNTINNYAIKLESLKKIKNNKYNYNIEKKDLIFLNKKLKELENIQGKVNYIENKTNKFIKLNSLKKELDSVNNSLKIGVNYIESLKDLNKVETYLSRLSMLIDKTNSILKLSNNLYGIIEEIKDQTNKLITTKKEIDVKLQAYEEIFIKSEICPFCLSSIDQNKINHINEHYS